MIIPLLESGLKKQTSQSCIGVILFLDYLTMLLGVAV